MTFDWIQIGKCTDYISIYFSGPSFRSIKSSKKTFGEIFFVTFPPFFLTTTCERISMRISMGNLKLREGRKSFYQGSTEKIWLGTPTDSKTSYVFFFLEYNTHRKSNMLGKEKEKKKIGGLKRKMQIDGLLRNRPPPLTVNSLILPTPFKIFLLFFYLFFWKIEKIPKRGKRWWWWWKKRRKKGLERAKKEMFKRKTRKWKEGRCLKNVEKQNCSG